jgi:hypothetical protein
MRRSSAKGSVEVEVRVDLLPSREDSTPERCHCFSGSESGRSYSSFFCSRGMGDLADSKPESTLDLLG